jgi:hypothetical protein
MMMRCASLFVLPLLSVMLLVRGVDANANAGVGGAGAGAGSGAGEVGVFVEGDANLGPIVGAHLRTWLSSRGHSVADAGTTARPPGKLVACLQRGDERCAREAFEVDGSTRVMVFAVIEATGAGSSRDVAVTAYWLRKGQETRAERRFCEKCSEADLRAAADDLMRTLAGSDVATVGRLRLTSTPVGAKVLVDGSTVGVTPLDYDLAEGDYDVSVVLDGHDRETRRLAIRGGETTRAAVPLAPSRDTGRGLLPPVLGGVGLAMLVTGGVLFAIDEDPSPTAPPQIRNTGPAGVALMAAGGAAIIAAAIVWVRRKPSPAAAPLSTPTAFISHRAGYIGWSTQF